MGFSFSGVLDGPPIIAVDPGKSGAVARLGDGRLMVTRDFKELGDIAVAIKTLATGAFKAVIEDVHAMPGQGVVSMFSFGLSTGWAQSALFLCTGHQPPLLVSPQKWQFWYRKELGIDKKVEFDSRAIATAIFPNHADLFKRKKDHNSADAVLLATWARYN
jgi:crossover junction endodeoxyribonuclease RuvC